ncbi:MAG: bifunctional diaminohydroxyphosphoribosylaminopyrimidine deaminase/5-amino-6-(5-phosphoribosylamino)uracil reductase RibD [Nitrospiraceae bacterium]|nr:MAG: bifunctional diaminohydroxyphosphoribosylaminopyrimidine deaminase/5-amino-6-(5-phosphoribosylamino)uracil reductase RibD [Nitrospiraceae bacterium]
MNDHFYMGKALALAARAKGRTSPNPLVGALVVKGDRIIAQGYHRKAGTPHAEAAALKRAGGLAAGATLFVTLEPCCHTGKRTPPCTEAIIQSRIKKVVAAMIDPNPHVSGRGLKELRKAGIKTRSGVMMAEARKLNEAFIKHVTTKEPFVILKIAQSLDGKIATARGESQWITGPKARTKVHELRNEVDALLVGIGTVRKDDPSLDCRMRGGRNPYRVIVDSRLEIPLKAKVLNFTDGKTIIASAQGADRRARKTLAGKGVQVLTVSGRTGSVDLRDLMKHLGNLGIMSVMIEGGSSIAASALAARIVDKVMFFVAPKIIGGTDAVPSVGGLSPALLKNAMQLRDVQVSRYGNDMLIEGYIV